jgi:hypothetical protein
MPEPAGSPPPRSGLSPAAWGALSAIMVAVIGGAVTLTTNWWQRKPAPTPAAPAAAAVPAEPAGAALPDPSTWAGAWRGTAKAPGEAPFQIELTITPGCVKDASCGTIRVPHVPCNGELTLVELRPDGAEFSVGHFDDASDRNACQPGAGEVLRARPDGSLAYTATYSGAHGVLERAN